ncbi:glycosyltransferase family 2 protein [Paenibacillus alvei]|uniref:Putative rhamnosyltransferase n=1 Tax=Paenibacillus alvei TaxID=44250 RepID=A0A383RIX3_PAEAL|nr:glycosyltransferase family 2 protein [Paenibacillus alvei]SYX86444.1 putative rhamnosyltransferase [Paenibacillus alvei]
MSGRQSKVQILLSTYNGEKFLAEQLDSLLQQTYSKLLIAIRDDGSTDQTKNIIQEYTKKYPDKIKFYCEKNTGVIPSFFKLLSDYILEEADYVCFCDQDDVWMPEKLERAIKSLERSSKDIPMMYVTSTQMVTEALEPLNVWPPVPRRQPTFYNALIENIAVGATIMMNRSAVHKLQSHMPNLEKIVMHDWWTYLVISAFGNVIYDEVPSIYYRQHQSNVIGGQKGFIDKWVKKWSNYKKHRTQKILWNQAKEFERCWGAELPTEFQSALGEFLLTNRGIVERARYAFSTRLYRQSKLDSFVFRLMMIRGDILK